jgi:hypothetical protein
MRTQFWLLTFGLLGCSAAHAQILVTPDVLTVHPYYPRPDGPFLIQIQDEWPDSCAGTVRTQVSADRIEIIAEQNRGGICGQVITPFRVLINPRDLAPAGTVFAALVKISYSFDDGERLQLRQNRDVSFDQNRSIRQVRAQSGGWVTPSLESSGLFIDQQGEVLSVALFDYDESGKASWHYGSGTVHDDAFVADLHSFAEIFCVTAPCPRAASVHSGRINMVLTEKNQLLVNFDGVLRSTRVDGAASYVYQRLDFQRSEQLANIDDSSLVPDLPGNWVAGLRTNAGQSDDFRAVTIRYTGSSMTAGVQTHRFMAFTGADDDGGSADTALFNLQCSTGHTTAAGPSCVIDDYVYGNLLCRVEFAYTAVGEARLSTFADCRDNATSTFLSTGFELFRIN